MSKEKWKGKAFYQVLGVDQSASIEEIKSQYRWLARKFHPDQNKNDLRAVNRFLVITEAYEVLSDPDLRVEYDLLLEGKITGSSAEHAPKDRGHGQPKHPYKPPYRGQGSEPRKPSPTSKPTNSAYPSTPKVSQAPPQPNPHIFDRKTPSFFEKKSRVGFIVGLISLGFFVLVAILGLLSSIGAVV